MKVAITGGSGHIGNCLIRELVKQGATVKVLIYDTQTGLDGLKVELFHGNLLEPESLGLLCEGTDVVFHLAARIAIDNQSPVRVYETNVTGTKNILNAAIKAGVKRFIHFSSIHAFQVKPSNTTLDETRPLVDSTKTIYEFTKAEGEREVMKAVKEGLNAVILNPTAVIGPYDYRNSLLGMALRKIHQGKLPFLVGGGYNWVDVRDVVSASIKAIEAGSIGEKYILSGEYRSLRDLCSMINKLSGSRKPLFVPVAVARLACPFFHIYSLVVKKQPLYTYQSLDILVNSPKYISNEKAGKVLGFNPRPLNQTLKDTFSWYTENNLIN